MRPSRDRAAWLMIRRYGEDAATQAAMRGDQLLATGDLEGMLVWSAIVRTIEGLLAKAPIGNEACIGP